MTCSRLTKITAAVVLTLALSWSGPVSFAASRVLPGLSFRVLRTAHFRIYYHAGKERLARALADVAESVRATVPARLGLSAPPVTHVLLVDQDDASNGWATPLPYDTVMVTAVWPAPSEMIGNTSDWLRLVFTHEFTHVLQLGQSRGWSRVVRGVFGRSPLAFPNLFLPQWQIEGLATFAESRFTGAGRLRAGDAAAVVGQRARGMGRERIDQVSGGQVVWPAGLGPYLYGGFFARYLAERYGEEKLGELARRTAGRLPYLGAPAFRQTFERGLGDLWSDFQATLTEAGTGEADCEAAAIPGRTAEPGCRRLTRQGFYVLTPRYAPDGRRLLYGSRNADDLPAVMIRDAEGAGASTSSAGRRLVTRFGGEQVSVSGSIAYFDQADVEQNVAWRSDLYAADVESGEVQRLTRGARLVAPDISTDGRLLACIEVSGEERRLAVFHVAGSRLGALGLSRRALPPSRGIFGAPRFSPDGKRVAVERRLPDGPSEIVIVDVETGQTRTAVSSTASRNLTPAWLPDGRTLLFASDRHGQRFQVYALRLESGELYRLTSLAGGAQSPDVSPDGARFVFVGATAAGYDLFEAPLRLIAPIAAEDSGPVKVETWPPPGPGAVQDFPYSPVFTLLPRSWQPAGDVVGNHVRLGLSTGGVDILGRQAFGVTALWRLEAGSNGMNGPHRGRPDWSAFYVYDRWRPSFFVTASDETTFLPQYSRGVRLADAELRQAHVSAGLSLPFLRLRHGQLWQTAINVERHRLLTLAGVRDSNRNAIQTGWAFNSTHEFGYSISPEQGVSLGVTSEQVRSAFGADGDADAFTGEFRGYLRAGGRHAVLAARLALAVANGDARVARVFYLGGAQPAGGLIDFGSGAFSLLRGYQENAFAASHLTAANLEYRFPIWRIDRGKGTWPLFLRTLHGAVFVDGGQVWNHRFTWTGAKTAVGAELSLDAIVGFGFPLTLSAGVARPYDGEGSRGTSAYLRLGRAF